MRLLSWVRRVGVAAAAIVAAGAIVLALLHAPSVRTRALSMLVGRLAQAGIVARADTFDYNLLTLTARIEGVSLATPEAAATPFLTAREIRLALPWAIVAGRFTINSVEIVSPAVTLRRDAQGRDNWTIQGGPRSSAAPPSIHLARLIVRDLTLDWTDEQQRAHADAALSFDLSAQAGATSGSIIVSRPARARFRDKTTSIAVSGGRLVWNGRDLALEALSLAAAEGAARIDARVGELLGAARIDARVDADANLEAVSAWAGVERELPGTAHASVHITGTDVALTSLTARLGGGEVAGEGQAALGGAGALRLTWREISLPSLLARTLANPPRVLPASVTAGTVDARWSRPAIDALFVNIQGSLAGRPSNERPSDQPVDAALALELRDRRWKLTADRVQGLGARGAAAVSGVLDPADMTRSTLAGTLRAQTIGDEGEWVRALVRAGWLEAAPRVLGSASADLAVSGTFGSPSLAGDVSATVQYEALPATSLRARASASTEAISLDDIDARMAGASVRGAMRWSIGSDAIAGTLSANLPLASLPDISSSIPRSLAPSGAIEATAVVSGPIARARAAIRASGRSLRIAGQTIDSLDAGGRVTGQDVTLDRMRLEQGAGRVEARGTYRYLDAGYAAQLTAADVALHPTIDSGDGPDTPATGRLNATFEGSGTLASLGGRGHINIEAGQWRSADLGAIGADLTLAGRGATLTFSAPDLALAGRATASIDPDGPVSIAATWAPADIAALARRMAVHLPISGSAEVGFDWSGARDRLTDGQGSLRIDRADVTLASQRFQLAQAGRIDGDAGVLRVRPIVIAAGASRLTIDGAQNSAGAPPRVALTLDGSLEDLAFVRELSQPQPSTEREAWPLSGAIRAEIVAEGAAADARLSATLAIPAGRIAVTSITGGHAVTAVAAVAIGARYADGNLTVDRATASFEGASLTATARVPSAVFIDQVPVSIRRYLGTASGPATLSAQLRSVTAAVAAPFVDAATLEETTLNAEATIDLESDRLALDSLRGTIVFPRASLALAGVSFDQQVPTRLAIRDGRLAVDAFRWGQGDNQIVVQGGATLASDPVLALTSTAVLDLRTLNALTRAVRTIGRGDAEIRIGGTAQAPTVDGYLTVSNAEARVADPRIVVGDLNGTVTFARDAMTFERLSATVNGGDAELAGSLRLRQFVPAEGSVTLTGRGVTLDLEGVRAENDVSLTWSIDNAVSTIGGSVTVLRSSYRKPLTVTSSVLSALRGSSAPVAAAAGLSIVDRTRLDVRIVTGDDLLIENNLGRLRLRGDVRAVGTVSKPSLTGRATIAEGGQVFFNGMRYRFEKDGSIDFANPNRVEPDFDLDVAARVQGIDITLTLTGTPAALEHTLQSPSNPELSQSDLVSLLLLGRTTGSGDALVNSDDLVNLVASGFIETAGRAIGLDTARIERGTPDVRLDAGLVAAETDPGARLTFGKTIGTHWDVVLSQSLQQSGGLTWIVGFKPRPRIDLRVVSLDDGDRFYTFSHDLTFGGPGNNVRRGTAATPAAPRVGDIEIVGAGPDETALRSRLKLQQGDRFSVFEAQDDRERIEGFYRERRHFEARVSARRESKDPHTVHLEYRIRPGPHTTVVVDGYVLSKSGAASIDRAWQGAVADEFLVDEAADAARADLAAAGYLQASVTARIESGADARTLRVTIVPGQRVSDRRVEFSGNQTQTAERLRAVLAERHVTSALWTNGGEVRDALTSFYRANGYLNASVRVDPIVISGTAATRPIHVDEGGAFQVASVRVEGVSAITADEAAGMIALTTGSLYTESGLEEAQQALDAQYRARGYNRVRIDAQAQTPQAAGRRDVAVVLRVDEGPQQRLREIVTDGVSRTRPALISRALKLEVGAPVDLAAWNAARRRVYETGAFRSVDIERTVIGTTAGEAEEPVRATVTVQEWPPVRVRYGLEIRDELNAAGDAARANVPEGGESGGRTFGFGLAGQLDTRGLFGTAISAGVAGRYAANTRASRVYLTSPSLFGHAIASTVFVERSLDEVGRTPDSNIKPFETSKTDFTFEQRIRAASRTTVSYLYTFERNHTRELEPDPLFPIGDLTVSIGKFAGTFIFDTRDDLSDASRGLFHSSTAQYAPDKLGSDLRFLKYFVQQRFYQKVRQVVFATSAQLGLATAFDTTLVPDQRFFAGGGNNVRGYDQDVLSPTDVFGTAVGGNALLVFNQEVRFPLFKYLRGVGFFDAGRAFERVGDLSLRELAPSAGLGFRVYTPFVLLRVDAGVPFDAAFGPRRARWFFSIGQMF